MYYFYLPPYYFFLIISIPLITTLPIDDSTNRFGPILRRKRTNATNPNPSNASLISVAFFRVKNFIEQIEFTFNEQIFLLCLFYEILEKREKNLTAGTINSLLIDVLTIVDRHFGADRKGDDDDAWALSLGIRVSRQPMTMMTRRDESRRPSGVPLNLEWECAAGF